MMKTLNEKIGYGFTLKEYDDALAAVYDYKNVGIYHNYFFNEKCTTLPSIDVANGVGMIIDGFSPNLNKELHVGHLKNLVYAKALSTLYPKCKIVAMLGDTTGIKPGAMEKIQKLWDFVGYKPEVYFASDMENVDISEYLVDGTGDKAGCKVYNNMVAVKSNGAKTYVYHDIAFAKTVKPTHYITGVEQIEHFSGLGFSEKHLPIGLVLGSDGTKMKSKTGVPVFLSDIWDACQNGINGNNKKQLTWNTLAFNLLLANPKANNKLDFNLLCNPATGGLYLSYTYAKLNSVFNKYGLKTDNVTVQDQELKNLTGYISYYDYYVSIAQNTKSFSELCVYAINLAKKINSIYAKQNIQAGSDELQSVMFSAFNTIGKLLNIMGLFTVEKV